MRCFTILILITIILLACQPNNSLSVPIITSTPSPIETKAEPSATNISEPSVTPETPEQQAFHLGEEAGLRGEPANDWQLWSDQTYRLMRAVPYDIVDGHRIANAEKMFLADTYVYGMRKGNFERFLQRHERQSKDILRFFYLNFLLGKVDVNTIPTQSQNELITQVKGLSNKEMSYLDLVYHMHMQDKNMPTFEEVRERLETRKILGSSNMKEGVMLPGSAGWYGLMAGENPLYPTQFNEYTYSVNMFGSKVTTMGDWLLSYSFMDFVGVENLSYGILNNQNQFEVVEVAGVTGLLKRNQQEVAQGDDPIQLLDLVVIPDGKMPIIFPEGMKYPGGGFTEIPLSDVPRIELNKTLFADRFNAVYRGNLDWMKFTERELLNKLSVIPPIIEVRSSRESQYPGQPGQTQSIFPHPVWGIPILAQSDRETGVVISGEPASDRKAPGIGATGINFWDPEKVINPWLH